MDGEWAAIVGAPLGILFLAYGIFKIDMTKKWLSRMRLRSSDFQQVGVAVAAFIV